MWLRSLRLNTPNHSGHIPHIQIIKTNINLKKEKLDGAHSRHLSVGRARLRGQGDKWARCSTWTRSPAGRSCCSSDHLMLLLASHGSRLLVSNLWLFSVLSRGSCRSSHYAVPFNYTGPCTSNSLTLILCVCERHLCTRPALPVNALFFETGVLTEPGAKLAASKPQRSCKHTLTCHR